MLFGQATPFCNNHDVGRGGVVAFLSPRWLQNVLDHSSDPTNCVIWILLTVNYHSFGIINIYASNDVERSLWWKWIIDSLPTATWVTCEDCNVVDMAYDKDGTFPFTLDNW